MKLHCPVCRKSYPVTSDLLVCPEGSEKHVHPLHKQTEKNDAALSIESIAERWNAGENGYSIFRECLGSFARAQANGSPHLWQANLKALERNARPIHAAGFDPSPLVDTQKIAAAIGFEHASLFVKNETATILGSHKARHAVASILQIENGKGESSSWKKPALAIFSCGNAALGAAAIAKASGYRLFTFVPAGISHDVEAILSDMNACVVKVRREGALGQGDPCNNLYHEAIRHFGLKAFSCYGHDLWVSVEGAEVLGLEFFTQIAFEQTDPESLVSGHFSAAKLRNLIVQVGGGGLAHGVVNAMHTALRLGILQNLPRLFLAQTASCYPLADSYFSILRLILNKTNLATTAEEALIRSTCTADLLSSHTHIIENVATKVASTFSSQPVQDALNHVAAHRGDFFVPWAANEPHSIAEGILDDTTYDGLEIARAMFQTGGIPVVLSEGELEAAWRMGQEATGLNVSATGTAGLAALQKLLMQKMVQLSTPTGLLFTGVEFRNAPATIKKENVVEVSPAHDALGTMGRFFALTPAPH